MTVAASSNLRVVILNDFCHVQGGASQVAIDEAISLWRSGVSVTFIGAVGPVCEELRATGMTVVNLHQSQLSATAKHPSRALQSLWNRTAHRAVKNVLDSMDRINTIVHIHGYTKALSTSPIRYLTKNGIQSICTLHDFFIACPNGAFYNFVDNKPCQLRALSRECVMTNCDKRNYSQKLYRVFRSMIQMHVGCFPRSVRNYVALSKQSAAILNAYLPFGSHIHLLSNPISVSQSSPVRVENQHNLIAIGRLDTEKGVKVLIDAARISNSSITLVGDGPWRTYAETYAGCRVTGWLPKTQVLAELEKARCLVFSSLWYETYGLVIAEAAARGVPSIVSDITAAAERVRHGITGWHTKAGDAAALAGWMEYIKSDSAVRNAGIAAYESYWEAPSTPAHHAASLLAIYTNILTPMIPATKTMNDPSW